MSRVNTTYTVANTSYAVITLTYASTFDPETFSSYSFTARTHNNADYIELADSVHQTTLKWTKCTSPPAVSRAALITSLNAVFNTNVFRQTLTLSPAATSDQFAMFISGSKLVRLSWPTPANDYKLTTPDPGSDAQYVLTKGATQTISGTKSFTGGVTTDVLSTGTFTVSTDNFMILLNTILASSNLGPSQNTLTLPSTSDTLVGRNTVDTLTNKTFTAPNMQVITVNGGANTVTLPTSTDTLVGRATSDTLTNKTLTTPTISSILVNGGANTVTLPTSTDTLVGKATTDTLTNKTLTSPVATNVQISNTGSFSVTSGRYGLNVLTSDGNAYFDHGTASKSVIFRSNNGATTQMTITDSKITVPRIDVSTSGILLPTTGGTATLLDFYEETTHASTYTGGTFTSGSITIGIMRIGKLVILRWPAIQGAATAAITNNTALPTRFFPTQIQADNRPGQVNSAVTPIQVSVGTTGTITFAQSNGTGFSAGTNGPSVGGMVYYLS